MYIILSSADIFRPGSPRSTPTFTSFLRMRDAGTCYFRSATQRVSPRSHRAGSHPRSLDNAVSEGVFLYYFKCIYVPPSSSLDQGFSSWGTHPTGGTFQSFWWDMNSSKFP